MVKKQKSLDILPEEVSIIVTKDGKIKAPNKNNELVCLNEMNNELPDVETMHQLLMIGRMLNSPGGINFETTKEILENYRFYSMSKSKRVEVQNDLETEYDFFQDGPIRLTVYDTDEIADLMNLIAMKDTSYSRRLARFVKKSENAALSYAVVGIVESGIEMLRSSVSYEEREYGEILYSRYVHPDYADENVEFFMEIAGKKKTAYHEALNKSICCLSGFLFGAFPGDHAFFIADYGKLEDEE